MDRNDSKLITAFSAGTAAISLILQPLPAAGVALAIPAQFLLAALLAKKKDRRLSDVPWGDVAVRILKANGLSLVVNLTIGRIPVVGNIANAATTFLLTRRLGRHFAEALDAADNPASTAGAQPPITHGGIHVATQP